MIRLTRATYGSVLALAACCCACTGADDGSSSSTNPGAVEATPTASAGSSAQEQSTAGNASAAATGAPPAAATTGTAPSHDAHGESPAATPPTSVPSTPTFDMPDVPPPVSAPLPSSSPTALGAGGTTPTVTPPVEGLAGAASGGGGSDGESGGGSGGSAGDGNDGLLAFGPPGAATEEMCGYCHGVNGEGTNLAPEIQHPVEDYATWVVRNGREHPDFEEPMPEYGEDVVSDELLGEIFVFLQSFPEPTTGEGLYLDHCANCHGVDALGGVTTRDISAEGPAGVLMHVRQGAHPGEFENRREYMHAYTAEELSDEQVQLIAEHIQSL